MRRSLEADANQGEFWVTAEDFENRHVDVTSLYSKNRFGYVFQIIRPSELCENDKIISKIAFRINVEETSSFTCNFFSDILSYSDLEFAVTYEDAHNQQIDLDLETHLGTYNNKTVNQKIVQRVMWIQKFTLERGTYKFIVFRKVKDKTLRTEEENMSLNSEKEEHYHIRIASTSKFEFTELNVENEFKLYELNGDFDAMNL